MKEISVPAAAAEIAELRIGDVFFLSGLIATGRDDAHRRIAAEGLESPFDFRGGAVFHAGPIVRERRAGEGGGGDLPPGGEGFEIVSIGPTSSIRMEEWAAGFLEKTGALIMIGKGGMGPKTADACRRLGAIHCVYPGGCAALGAGQVEKIEGAYWRELGMPECVWAMRVRRFGPLIVSIDAAGRSMFAENAALYASRMEACMQGTIEALRSWRAGERA